MSYIYSEQSFRRYEHFIISAVENFPVEVHFAPQGGRSVQTEVARCRDAITSFRHNQWKTKYNYASIEERVEQLVTTIHAGHVVIMSKWMHKVIRQPYLKRAPQLSMFIQRLEQLDPPRKSLMALAALNPVYVYNDYKTQTGASDLSALFSSAINTSTEISPPIPSTYDDLSLSDIVDQIDKGEITCEISRPLDDDTLKQLHVLLKDKMNVAYRIKDNEIIIY